MTTNVKTVRLEFDKKEDGIELTDITRQVEHSVIDTHVIDGIVTISVSSPELSITTMEYEPGTIKDMKDAMEKLAPMANGGANDGGNKRYAYGLGGLGTAVSYRDHSRIRHDEDGSVEEKKSDVMHAILGPSITIPVKDNRIMVGIWQKVVLMNFKKERGREKVTLQVIGEFERG